MTDAALQPDIPFDTFYPETMRQISPRKSNFGRLPLAKLNEPGPEHEFIIDEFLSVGDISVICGESQSGKSFLAIKAAMCIATGQPFFGRSIERPGLVVYQAGEGARGIKKRLRAYLKHADMDPGQAVPFELLQSPVNLYRADADTGPLIEEIKWIASEWPGVPSIILFVDTLAVAMSGADENSGKDISVVLENIARISRECRIHVCLVHHMNAGGEKMRGHTSIRANIEQVITVKRDKVTNIRTAFLDKQRDEDDGVSFRFELMKIDLGKNAKGKDISSCVCAPVGEKAAEAAALKSGMWRLGPEAHVAMIALCTALKKLGRKAPDKTDCPTWAESITLANWQDEYAKLKAGIDENPDALKERVKKARERATLKFLSEKLIGKDGDWVWRTKRKIFGIDKAPKDADVVELPPDLIDELSRIDDPVF